VFEIAEITLNMLLKAFKTNCSC